MAYTERQTHHNLHHIMLVRKQNNLITMHLTTLTIGRMRIAMDKAGSKNLFPKGFHHFASNLTKFENIQHIMTSFWSS